ncbi:MAG: PKD-like domain-containing protein, partial [bacterium]
NAVSISGTLSHGTNAPILAVYNVVPQGPSDLGFCIGSTIVVNVTVDPKPSVTPMSTVVCSGVGFVVSPVDGTNGLVPVGTSYRWNQPSVSNASLTGGISQSGASVFGTLTNQTNFQQTATYLVIPSFGACSGLTQSGNPFTVTVNVNPAAIINTINTTVCSGQPFQVSPTTPANGIVPQGTTYQWDIPSMENASLTGGASASAGQLLIAGEIDNPTNTRYYARYFVVPTTGICVGSTFVVNAFINPIPDITPMSTVVCSGEPFSITPTHNINGSVPVASNMFYTWNNRVVSNPLLTGTGSGSSSLGNYFTGVLTNGTNTIQTATYQVTPVYRAGGVDCAGTAFTATIFVKAKAVINTMTTATCSGVPFNFTPTNGSNGIVPPNTKFTWLTPSMTPALDGGESATSLQESIFGRLTSTSSGFQTATYTVTPVLVNECVSNSFTLIVTIYPEPLINAMSTVTCSGIPFAVSPVDVTNGRVPQSNTYEWGLPTHNNSLSGGESRNGQSYIFGTLNSSSNFIETATYSVIPTSQFNCKGAAFTVTVFVNPGSFVTDMTTTSCSGVMFNVTPVNGTNGVVPDNTVYTWEAPTYTGTVTGGASSNGAQYEGIFGTLFNRTNTIQTATYRVTAIPPAQNCSSGQFTLTVTLYPAPQITEMSTVVCSGTGFAVAATETLNGIVPQNTQYRWNTPTLSTSSITNGSGNPTYVNTITGLLFNGTNTTQTATYLVTPRATLASCVGNPFTLTVWINPTPAVSNFNRVICSGASFLVVPFTDYTNGIVPNNTSYSWATPVTPGVSGLLPASNVSSISGTLSHTTNSQQLVTYQVVPVAGVCTGATFVVNVTVNPVPAITPMSTTSCSGVLFTVSPAQNINGIVPAAANMNYSWFYLTASNASLTGGENDTSGFGNPITGTLTNGTNIQQTATYNVTPTYLNSGVSCLGNTFSVVVYVNPKAVITVMTTVVCSGSAFQVSPTDRKNGIVPDGTTYTWLAPNFVLGTLQGGVAQLTPSVDINGKLRNTTNVVRTAVYIVTPEAPLCPNNNSFTLTVFVNPTPEITPMSTVVCSGNTFQVSPTNSINGIVPGDTKYSWDIPSTSSASLVGGEALSGKDYVYGTLINQTNTAKTATYIVTPLTTGGTCAGATFTVDVTVNPGGYITEMSTTVCSGFTFEVSPRDIVNGVVPANTKYSWDIPSYNAQLLGGESKSGQDYIFGKLTNKTNITQSTTYI